MDGGLDFENRQQSTTFDSTVDLIFS